MAWGGILQADVLSAVGYRGWVLGASKACHTQQGMVNRSGFMLPVWSGSKSYGTTVLDLKRDTHGTSPAAALVLLHCQ
jgi:hypothetical protein